MHHPHSVGLSQSSGLTDKEGEGKRVRRARALLFLPPRNKQAFLWKETIKGGVYDETGRKTVSDADMAT